MSKKEEENIFLKNQKIPENDVLTNKTRERIKEIMSQQSAQ